MQFGVRVLRHRLWLACVCLLLGATVAAASTPSVVADFDGDGQHDRAEVSPRGSAIHIWLSATRSTSVLRSRTPIL